MNSDELESLFSTLRQVQPTAEQLSRWSDAAQFENRKRFFLKPSFKLPLQMASMLAVGFLLGTLFSSGLFEGQKNFDPSATIQYTFSKSE